MIKCISIFRFVLRCLLVARKENSTGFSTGLTGRSTWPVSISGRDQTYVLRFSKQGYTWQFQICCLWTEMSVSLYLSETLYLKKTCTWVITGTSCERVVPLFLFAKLGRWTLICSELPNSKTYKVEIWTQHDNKWKRHVCQFWGS